MQKCFDTDDLPQYNKEDFGKFVQRLQILKPRGVNNLNIFKEFDAILAALKPSQYRPLWQLYNYDRSKRSKYKNKYQFGQPGEMSNVLTVDLYKQLPKYISDNVLLEQAGNKNIIKVLYRYCDMVESLRIGMQQCLGKKIDRQEFNKQFQVDRFRMFSRNKSELWDEYCNISTDTEKVDGREIRSMDFDEALKYLPPERSDRIVQAMDAYRAEVLEYFRKHIGETIPLDVQLCEDIHEKDGIYYWNPSLKRRTGMDEDTLIWHNANAAADDRTTYIKANPKVRTLYNSLFPDGKYRIFLPTIVRITKKDIYAINGNNNLEYLPDIKAVMRGIFSLAQKYLKEKKHVDLKSYDGYDLDLDEERVFIDGLFDYEKNGKNVSIRIGKILEGYRNNIDSLSKDERLAVKYYHLIKQPRQFKGYIVISRHPYDIAGMSTGRGWTSCQSLENGGFNKFVPQTIAAGGLIAYLCNEDDKNIKNPKGRVLIKPFTRHTAIDYDHPDFMLFCSKTYGVFYDSCIKELQDWLDDNWNSHIDQLHYWKPVGDRSRYRDVFNTLPDAFYDEDTNQGPFDDDAALPPWLAAH